MQNIIKLIWRKAIPDKIKTRFDPIYRKYFSEYRERRISPGYENSDKVFYVIRNMTENQGLLNNWIEAARKVEYAFSRKYIPIIDFKNYYQEGYQDKINQNSANGWDYYFRQPQEQYSLDDVYQSKNVILSYGQDVNIKEKWPVYQDAALCKRYHDLFENYIGLRPELIREFEELKDRYFPKNSRILGISLRRELEWGCITRNPFYVDEVLHHPKSTIESTIADINKYMEEYSCDYFFLAYDDWEAGEVIRRKFGDKMLCTDRARTHFFENGVPITMEERYRMPEFKGEKYPLYRKAKDYLAETYLLSKGTLMAGIDTSACTVARIINGGKFEHVI